MLSNFILEAPRLLWLPAEISQIKLNFVNRTGIMSLWKFAFLNFIYVLCTYMTIKMSKYNLRGQGPKLA